jgi:predicted neuraminidase
MMGRTARVVVLAIAAVAFGAGAWRAAQRPPAADFATPPRAAPTDTTPRFETRFASSTQSIATHAANLIELRDGRVRALWFAGSREGAGDVAIRTAVFDPALGGWSAEHIAIEREDTQVGLRRFVRKLGNAVVARAPDGTLRVWYVTVSIGGWAGASITTRVSTDDGESWGAPRRIVTSPFANISTLVRGDAFGYADGTLGLPVYHEFAGKFGELLRLDAHGRVLDKQRLSDRREALQPVVLVRSEREALAIMRRSGSQRDAKVLAVRTDDAGRHWTAPATLALPNPDAAVAGVVLADGMLLVALNQVETNRDQLALAASTDGGTTWRTVAILEDQRLPASYTDPATQLRTNTELARSTAPALADPAAHARSAAAQMCEAERCRFEFSYPTLLETRAGELHLAYTWNRSFIKHVRFNRAWIDRQLAEGGTRAGG